MSEQARTDSAARRPLLFLVFAGIAIVLGAMFAGAAAWIIALVACALLAGFAVYFAAQIGNRAVQPRAAISTQAAGLATARDVLETLADPVIILDGSGRIVLANHASDSVIGPGNERKHISAVLRTPDVLEAINRVLKSGIGESVDFSFLVPVERHYTAFIAAAAHNGGMGGFVLIQLHDLTAIRRAEQMRADFVANASHELRTPLAAVSGFIETLRGHAKNDEVARERFLDIMSVEAGRMQRLIDDLLSLTRIELNEHNLPDTVVDLAAIVRDAVAVLTPLAAADHVTLQVVPQDPLLTFGDRDQLTQVFQNLIHNAIKYGREAGTVRIAFGRAAGESRREATAGLVFAQVIDDGEGIAREAIPRLTERFYRVDIKRSRERGGTGLGLAIVKHILNRHHGRLSVESAPGKGSTFTVFLPAAPEGAVAAD